MKMMLKKLQQDLALAIRLAQASSDREVFIRGREISYDHGRRLVAYVIERELRPPRREETRVEPVRGARWG